MKNPYAEKWLERYGKILNIKISAKDDYERSDEIYDAIENNVFMPTVGKNKTEYFMAFKDFLMESDLFDPQILSEDWWKRLRVLTDESFAIMKAYAQLTDDALDFHQKLEEKKEKEQEKIQRELDQKVFNSDRKVPFKEIDRATKQIKKEILLQMLEELK